MSQPLTLPGRIETLAPGLYLVPIPNTEKLLPIPAPLVGGGEIMGKVFGSDNWAAVGAGGGPGGGIDEAPEDGTLYGRQDAGWVAVPDPTPIPDAPADGSLYGRQDGGWLPVPDAPPFPEAPEDGVLYGRQDAGWAAVPPIPPAVPFPEAPEDGSPYARQDAGWVAVPDAPPFPEAPLDGELYGRQAAGWVMVPPIPPLPPLFTKDEADLLYVALPGFTQGDADGRYLQFAEAAATYLPLDGAVPMTGLLTLSGRPIESEHAASKGYVDDIFTSGNLYMGTWEVAANEPPLTPPALPLVHGQRYLCITDDPDIEEQAPASMPGIGGRLIHNGSFIMWDAHAIAGGQWTLVAQTGNLTKNLADTLYLSLTGGTLTGALALPQTTMASLDEHAPTKLYVDTQDHGPWMPIPLGGGFGNSTLQGRLIHGGTSVEIRGDVIGLALSANTFPGAVPIALRPTAGNRFFVAGCMAPSGTTTTMSVMVTRIDSTGAFIVAPAYGVNAGSSPYPPGCNLDGWIYSLGTNPRVMH
jgi:hypothetical protein